MSLLLTDTGEEKGTGAAEKVIHDYLKRSGYAGQLTVTQPKGRATGGEPRGHSMLMADETRGITGG